MLLIMVRPVISPDDDHNLVPWLCMLWVTIMSAQDVGPINKTLCHCYKPSWHHIYWQSPIINTVMSLDWDISRHMNDASRRPAHTCHCLGAWGVNVVPLWCLGFTVTEDVLSTGETHWLDPVVTELCGQMMCVLCCHVAISDDTLPGHR